MTAQSDERRRRETTWKRVLEEAPDGVLSASRVRELGIYGGAQGVWVDKAGHTGAIRPDGVAVGIRLTGRHYPDDRDDYGVIYHYPKTLRPPRRDASEIKAMKNAQELEIPIFITSEVPRQSNLRQVQQGWVIDHDDDARLFLVAFDQEDASTLQAEVRTEAEFIGVSNRRRTSSTSTRTQRSSFFKFGVFQRYGGKCPLTGCSVPEMLQAAHVIPVEAGGSDDLRNGLLLEAGIHLALDAGLWALEPHSLRVVTRPVGPTAAEMGMRSTSLDPASEVPHKDALEFRYAKFLQDNKL